MTRGTYSCTTLCGNWRERLQLNNREPYGPLLSMSQKTASRVLQQQQTGYSSATWAAWGHWRRCCKPIPMRSSSQ
ncbi:hypothetical protein WJX72_010451 [[Myrmecia] bisecta]|uniref:Uncharacterized protein n=1 Tax=[Myrmecia] bisecta TaxID=41462 RepID=A0AAW1P4Y1_9CHLO